MLKRKTPGSIQSSELTVLSYLVLFVLVKVIIQLHPCKTFVDPYEQAPKLHTNPQKGASPSCFFIVTLCLGTY